MHWSWIVMISKQIHNFIICYQLTETVTKVRSNGRKFDKWIVIRYKKKNPFLKIVRKWNHVILVRNQSRFFFCFFVEFQRLDCYFHYLEVQTNEIENGWIAAKWKQGAVCWTCTNLKENNTRYQIATKYIWIQCVDECVRVSVKYSESSKLTLGAERKNKANWEQIIKLITRSSLLNIFTASFKCMVFALDFFFVSCFFGFFFCFCFCHTGDSIFLGVCCMYRNFCPLHCYHSRVLCFSHFIFHWAVFFCCFKDVFNARNFSFVDCYTVLANWCCFIYLELYIYKQYQKRE